MLGYLDDVILPYRGWLESQDAAQIAASVSTRGVHGAIAVEVAPLVASWDEWRSAGSDVNALLLDFWGRGGFARVAAAIGAKPHAAIAVDARSIDEIRRWSWMLCALFDTVLVKWKGERGEGIVLAPMRVDYGGPGAFGGHGYVIMGGYEVRENWTIGMSWANPLPPDVATFLATDALPLVAAGPLVVVPAPSVGCTQNAVGWTDELLLGGLLRGVVSVVSAATDRNRGAGRRVLDLATHTLPYVSDIGLVGLRGHPRRARRLDGPPSLAPVPFTHER